MGKRDVKEDNAAEIEHIDRGITSLSDISLNFQNFNLTRLTLSHNKLTSIPQNISELVNLEVLTLWNNQIEELPISIASLPRLRCLNVGMNRLSILPRGFGSCPSLEVLDLTYNNLSERSLPGNFFFIRTLRALYLSDNDFEYFPADVEHLKNLQILGLRDNDLLELPGELGNLPKLRELHIQGNRLRMVPPELGRLDLVGSKQVCRLENNPWIGPLAEQLRDGGVTAFWEYIRSENYSYIYGKECMGQSPVPPKNPHHNKKTCRLPTKPVC
uniref:Ras suppressor protein 1 n=1 Tax=Steinernema glaseri TaxID=37863 RepID=A0A1I8ABC2_9BILA